jgi:hypothetical protein
MLITRRSPLTGTIHSMELDITLDQCAAYASGVLLQDAFPNLNDSEREFFKSGITSDEWDFAFGDIEDDFIGEDNTPAV